MKWKEGRCTVFKISSEARKRRLSRLNQKIDGDGEAQELKSSLTGSQSLSRPEIAATRLSTAQYHVVSTLFLTSPSSPPRVVSDAQVMPTWLR